VACSVAALLLAGGLKTFYSRAAPGQLEWLLAPTAAAVGLVSGIEFEREPGTGWINHPHRIILGPSCAGVNFLVICLLTYFFSFARRCRRDAARWAWLGASLGIAYALTLAANSLRVAAAIRLYEMDIYSGALTKEGVHRIAGAAVYCSALLAGYVVLERLPGGRLPSPAERRPAGWLGPFAWYLGIALGIPLVGQIVRPDAARFARHAIPVALVCAIVALASVPVRGWLRGAGVKRPGRDARIRLDTSPAARSRYREAEGPHRR